MKFSNRFVLIRTGRNCVRLECNKQKLINLVRTLAIRIATRWGDSMKA